MFVTVLDKGNKGARLFYDETPRRQTQRLLALSDLHACQWRDNRNGVCVVEASNWYNKGK